MLTCYHSWWGKSSQLQAERRMLRLLHKSSFLSSGSLKGEQNVNEVTLVGILGIASRDLREGRNLHALQLFGSLAQVEFKRQRDARLGFFWHRVFNYADP